MRFLIILISGLTLLSSCEHSSQNRKMTIKSIIASSVTNPVIVIAENNTKEYTYKLNYKWVTNQHLEVGETYPEELFSMSSGNYDAEYMEFELVALEDCPTSNGQIVIIGYFIPRSPSFSRLELEKIIFLDTVKNPNDGNAMSIGDVSLFKGVWGDGYKPVVDISEEEYHALLGVNAMGSI